MIAAIAAIAAITRLPPTRQDGVENRAKVNSLKVT